MTLHTRNEINRRARKALICDFSDAEKLRSQYEMMGNLSRTANGNLSGSVKLDSRPMCSASIPADHSCG